MKPFLKFLLSLLFLLALCALADRFIGLAMDRILEKVPTSGNDVGPVNYALKEVTHPVLIAGSSRARDHYYPDVFTDSLSLETYNVGMPGYFISYNCCLINTILDRYTPKIIIWELCMESLFELYEDPVAKLRPYYWVNSSARELIDAKEGKWARIKYLSNAYRYNDASVDILYRWLYGGPDNDPNNGMTPLSNTGSRVDPVLSFENAIGGTVDTERVKRLHDTLQRLNDAGVKVFVFDSPLYYLKNPDRDMSSESIIYEECQSFSIPVFDNRYLDYFHHHPEMFRDESHLFDVGARTYSQIAAHQILQVLRNEEQ